METLFSSKYENVQPLRKYEPLIRFDAEGNPQPRKPLDAKPDFQDTVITPTAAPSTADPKSAAAPSNKPPHEDLKRKMDSRPGAGMEPKKKQQKQTSIMSFFKKG